ncbi:MAG: ABC transporter ATP-binding protein [Candidatus Odinarchaeota archaeon]|nr:ABC transporter ATP-binding protein [Candidatus Odinarchaeota archaeon]
MCADTRHNGEPIIRVRNLVKWYELRAGFFGQLLGKKPIYVRAVDGVSFDLYKGEILVLAGESGCGKTTTGKTILYLIPPTSGEVLFNSGKFKNINVFEVDKSTLKELRKKMQIIFQDPYESLNPKMSVYDIIAEPLRIHKITESHEEERELISKVLEEVQLIPPEDFMFRYPHELSGGQRQRVSVARAIVLRPEFIVADEPVSMLDVSIRAGILKLLLNLRKEHNISYLFITHDLAVAGYIGDRIAIMYLGKIVEIGNVDDVLHNSMHPYTQLLIESVPKPDPTKRKRKAVLTGEPPSPINPPSGCRFHPRCPFMIKGKCDIEEPPQIEVGNGHMVSCWLHVKR